MSNTGENRPVPEPENINHEDVYLEDTSSEQQGPPSATSRSSFTLAESENSQPEQLNINNVLNKLGLVERQPAKQVRQAINNVVSNFIEMDDRELHQEHEQSFRQKYQTAAQNVATHNNKYIYVSEYEDIEYLEVLSEESVLGRIKKAIRLLLKKISLLSLSIISHDAFEFGILLVIILNSVKMALDDPLSSYASPEQKTIENIFIVLYCIEMGLKILAYGFVFNPGSYLRDAWNIMDFVIVVTSLLPFFINLGFSVNSLRAIRVLRPLKTITKVKVLKMIVRTLFLSFSLVLDSLYILVFVMIIFSIAGLQLFSGVLKNRCIEQATGILSQTFCASQDVCLQQFGVGFSCAKGIASPNFSVTNFDTFIWSMLSVFQILTMEGWSSIMIQLQQCYSVVCFLYCVLIVFFCEYVLLNITLAILKYKYAQVKDNSVEEEEEEKFEYSPELLKKIGVYNTIAQIKECDFERYPPEGNKVFVGAIRGYQQEKIQQQLRLERQAPRTVVRKYSKFGTAILRKQRNKAIVESHRNETFETKWDPKALKFESIKFDQVQIDERAVRSRRQLKEQLEHMSNNIYEQNISEEDEELQGMNSPCDSDEQQQGDEMQVEIMKPPTPPDEPIREANAFATERMISYLKPKKENGEIKDLFQFNQLLSELEKTSAKGNMPHQATLVHPKSSNAHFESRVSLPDLQIDDDKREKFYKHFSSLGRYGVKVNKMPDIRKTCLIGRNRTTYDPNAELKVNKRMSIVNINEEIQLDIKQLELVNELSKKKMKCRLKSLELLEEQTKYPTNEVLLPKKKKKEELQAANNEEDKPRLQRPKIVYIVPEQAKEETDKIKLQEKALKKKQKPQRNMSRCLYIPEFGEEAIKFIKKANRVVNSKNMNEGEESLELEKIYKNRLKLRGNAKKWEEDQPTEVDLVKQYFNVSDYSAKPMKKVRSGTLGDEAKQSTADQDFVPSKAAVAGEEKQSLQQKYNTTVAEMDASTKPEYELLSSAEDLRKLLTPIEIASISCLNIADSQYEIYIEGVSGVFKVFRNKIGMLLATGLYDNFMLTMVMANTVLMCLNGLVDSDSTVVSTLNLAFTYIFTVDITLKLLAYGSGFFEDVMNFFDMFVVVVSLVDASLDGLALNLTALRSIRIFRAFRVLRVTRLVRSLSFMKIVMAVVVSVISEFVYIFMLLALFIFIYTLLGMQIFGGSLLPFSVVGIRQSFDTFLYSLFSVFQILTVENWNDIETTIGASNNNNITILFPISWIFIGNWILMNLLQAILLDGFDENTNSETKEAVEAEKQIDQELRKTPSSQPTQLEQTSTHMESNPTMQYTKVNFQTQPSEVGIQIQLSKEEEADEDYSLFLFPKSGCIRTNLAKVLKHKVFEYIVMICIAMSSAKLVFDTYIEDPNSDLAAKSNIMDTVFNIIFIVECAMNIVSSGFILGRDSYLSNNWSKLDFFIIITAIVDMSMKDVDLSIMKMLRSLRPLRILTRNLNMRIIIVALGQSMAGIANVLIIILMVFLMFGILAITLLQNKLNYCNMPKNGLLTYNNYGPYGVTQAACLAAGGSWVAQFINFDNILQSLLSLYVFSTRQNWPYYVYTLIDAEIGGPVKDNSYVLFFLFSVVFIFVCSYFFMDLLVGVLFLNFHRAENKLRPKILLDCQINWINLQKLVVTTDPCLSIYIRPENSIKRLFFDLVGNRYYEWFSLSCILLNIISMMLAMDDETDGTAVILKTVNTVFSGIFLSELIFKLLAYGKGYFLVGWNLFDFVVVLASVIDFLMDKLGIGVGNSALSVLPQIARISRVLRVTRILRMFKRFKGLQKLIETFIFMMPALGNGLALIALFLFISSVVSSYLLQNIVSDGSGFYSETSNFLNFHRSLQLLFICTTGENWYVYMYESMIPGYVQCATSDSCTSPVNLLFWLIYIFFSQKVFMEMLVLIVLDQFESNYINENNPLGIFALLEDDFRTVWIEKTQKHKVAKLQSKKLVDLILCLKPPLGIGVEALQNKYEEELKQNHNLKEEEIKAKSYQFYMKLKHTSAKWALKMEDLLNKTYIGYHETFYNCAKYAYMNEFLDKTTPTQLELIEVENKKWEEQLKAIREALQLNGKDKAQDNDPELHDMNPMQIILFSQMIIKAWNNYALIKDGKKNVGKDQSRTNLRNSLVKKERPNSNDPEEVDSYLNSCGSIQEEAKLQIIDNFKKRRQGIIIVERSGRPFIPETETYEDLNHSQNKRGRRSRIRPSVKDMQIDSSSLSGSLGMQGKTSRMSAFSGNE